MTESDLYNMYAAANSGKRELKERIDALEAAIRILADRLPPGDFSVVKRELNDIGIKVKRSN